MYPITSTEVPVASSCHTSAREGQHISPRRLLGTSANALKIDSSIFPAYGALPYNLEGFVAVEVFVLWKELYAACVLETNAEKLKALIYATENAIISRLQTLDTPHNEHRDIARASACLLVLKSERFDCPGHLDTRNSPPREEASEKMKEHLPANVQSCPEYEHLFDKCLDALTRWTQLHGVELYPGSMATPIDIEVGRAQRNYAAAFSALHQHSRCGCSVCEDRLRVHGDGFPVATPYRSRELALWEHRKSSRDLARRLSATPLKTDSLAPQPVMPEHPPMSIRMAKLVQEMASWNCFLDRWWSTTFPQAMDWTFLSKIGFAGVLLLTIALRMSPLPPWQQIVRVPFGFSGILLIDVSLGFGAFVLVYDGSLARQIRHLRGWLHSTRSPRNG